MSIPNIHRDGSTLHIKIQGNFNLWTKNIIANRINDDIDNLHIDFSVCTLIDSEAIIFLYTCEQKGNALQLINPPDVFFEILEILELNESWQPNILTPNEESL